MSVTSGFFNSKNGDRKYNAEQMSSLFDGIIRDGIFQHIGTSMMVTAGSGMEVIVGIGRAWFKHTWTLNDSLLPLAIEPAEVLYKRIDAVVLEVDNRENVRQNSIKVIKGTPGNSPERPTLIKENDRAQHALAYVEVSSAATSITQANITNMVGTGDTPFITSPLEKMNIDSLVAQWQSQYTQWRDGLNINAQNWRTEFEQMMNGWKTNITQNYDSWTDEKRQAFSEWFESIRGQLSGDVAANLASKIAQLEANKNEVANNLLIINDKIKKAGLMIVNGSFYNNVIVQDFLPFDNVPFLLNLTSVYRDSLYFDEYSEIEFQFEGRNHRFPIKRFNDEPYLQESPEGPTSLTGVKQRQFLCVKTGTKIWIDVYPAMLEGKLKETSMMAERAFTQARSGKSTIASAITSLGVPTSEDDSFDTISSKIRKLKVLSTDKIISPSTFRNYRTYPSYSSISSNPIPGILPKTLRKMSTRGVRFDSNVAIPPLVDCLYSKSGKWYGVGWVKHNEKTYLTMRDFESGAIDYFHELKNTSGKNPVFKTIIADKAYFVHDSTGNDGYTVWCISLNTGVLLYRKEFRANKNQIQGILNGKSIHSIYVNVKENKLVVVHTNSGTSNASCVIFSETGSKLKEYSVWRPRESAVGDFFYYNYKENCLYWNYNTRGPYSSDEMHETLYSMSLDTGHSTSLTDNWTISNEYGYNKQLYYSNFVNRGSGFTIIRTRDYDNKGEYIHFNSYTNCATRADIPEWFIRRTSQMFSLISGFRTFDYGYMFYYTYEYNDTRDYYLAYKIGDIQGVQHGRNTLGTGVAWISDYDPWVVIPNYNLLVTRNYYFAPSDLIIGK